MPSTAVNADGQLVCKVAIHGQSGRQADGVTLAAPSSLSTAVAYSVSLEAATNKTVTEVTTQETSLSQLLHRPATSISPSVCCNTPAAPEAPVTRAHTAAGTAACTHPACGFLGSSAASAQQGGRRPPRPPHVLPWLLLQPQCSCQLLCAARHC